SVLPPAGYTITGSIAYAGAKTGRIYIVVETAMGSSQAGTSLAAPGAFTVRGVQANGTLTVRAWRDSLGSASYNASADPVGTATVTVPQPAGPPLTVTMTDPTPSAPTLPSAAASPY